MSHPQGQRVKYASLHLATFQRLNWMKRGKRLTCATTAIAKHFSCQLKQSTWNYWFYQFLKLWLLYQTHVFITASTMASGTLWWNASSRLPVDKAWSAAWFTISCTPVPGLRSWWLSLGNWVRMSKTRRQFAKGYTGHWLKEIFWVEAMRVPWPTWWPTLLAFPSKGTFYRPQLQKVMRPDHFDMEAILDTWWRGGKWQYLVKWTGYPVCFNSWESDTVRFSNDVIVMPERPNHQGTLAIRQPRGWAGAL